MVAGELNGPRSERRDDLKGPLEGILTGRFVVVVLPTAVVAFALFALLRWICGIEAELKGPRGQEASLDAHGFEVEDLQDNIRHLP